MEMTGTQKPEQPEDIDCRAVVELVTDYLEGALDDSAVARVEAHLALCDGCDAYLDQLRATVSATGSVSADHLPPEAVAALVQAFRDAR
jgi:predicted anti-sigma-YlaC factor YlaD